MNALFLVNLKEPLDEFALSSRFKASLNSLMHTNWTALVYGMEAILSGGKPNQPLYTNQHHNMIAPIWGLVPIWWTLLSGIHYLHIWICCNLNFQEKIMNIAIFITYTSTYRDFLVLHFDPSNIESRSPRELEIWNLSVDQKG